ncbi:hypothetical protein LNKW23_04260 [Paralimibaculum aggregatum]|uniref:VOC domain-containing protein n=1 Tax=Paralimibaculum aggregatum TaxID=3036245 RepID=A0ABQ6LCW5_9RHOB|nr:VOC family protein [Limibaculum sp. NKW23]GMG81214.1 hypothetical protein LNKW23_04260 [Limibaculum sp. NKW23]
MQFGRAHGDIHWLELMTRDTASATAFYTQVLGWDYEEVDMGMAEPYRLLKRGDEMIGGLMSTAGIEGAGDMGDRWLPYFAVDDVDAAAEAVAAGGGQVLQPVFEVPEVGRMATVADPTGAILGIITPAAQRQG